MNSIIFRIFICLYMVSHVRGYQSGAPIVTCESMTPGHDVKAQTTPSPFQVKAEKTHVAVGSPVEIALVSPPEESFRGFFVQVRMAGQTGANSKKAMGTFVENTDPLAKTIACNGKENTAVTHLNKEQKTLVKLKWIPSEPGRYKIHSTFVLTFDIFWVDVQNDEVIEVHETEAGHDHGQAHGHGSQEHSSSQKPKMDNYELCSTMKLNASIEPQTVSSPYDLMISPIIPGKYHHEDNHLVEQKGMMWFNISSEFGTPIEKLFLQVRKAKGDKNAAYGQFMLPTVPTMTKQGKSNYKLVDCFGKTKNAILFVDEDYQTGHVHISEFSFKWEAPSDETGDFEVVGSILRDDNFWNYISMDKEKRRIRVVRKQSMPGSQSSQSKPGSSSSTSTTASSLDMTKLSVFFLILFANL